MVSVTQQAVNREQVKKTGTEVRDTFTILTSVIFNSIDKTWIKNYKVIINKSTGLIDEVSPYSNLDSLNSEGETIDLRRYTILPGFVDSHSHLFLHEYTETPSIYQERDESLVERICRATQHAKSALKAGYTTYRDLGSEGLQDADIGIRDAINRGIIPGPRMFVVSEALASSGGYGIRYESRLNGTKVPRLSDTCDGVEGCIAGVRRRLGAGADVIKFYGDYRRRTLRFPPQNWPGARPVQFPPSDNNPVSTLFTLEEMKAIVQTANTALCPVAAHCVSTEATILASKAGVTTIEHNYIPSSSSLKAMKENDIIFVPTLTIVEAEGHTLPNPEKSMEGAWEHTRKAYEMGIRIAAGGDIGAVRHGENIREVELMITKCGIPLEEALKAVSYRGWEACGGDWCGRKFGYIGKGWAGDLVVLDGNPREDLGALRKVKMVFKDGRMVVKDGVVVE